jgi:hypothetical protein
LRHTLSFIFILFYFFFLAGPPAKSLAPKSSRDWQTSHASTLAKETEVENGILLARVLQTDTGFGVRLRTVNKSYSNAECLANYVLVVSPIFYEWRDGLLKQYKNANTSDRRTHAAPA